VLGHGDRAPGRHSGGLQLLAPSRPHRPALCRARIDGVRLFGLLRHITLPIAKAGLGTATLFAVLLAWDEFFYALLYTSDNRAKTIPVAIADFAAGRATDYGLVSAVGVLAALPPTIFAVLFQRSLVSGLSAGSVKG
jgi:multiple sugar transport system permease protein